MLLGVIRELGQVDSGVSFVTAGFETTALSSVGSGKTEETHQPLTELLLLLLSCTSSLCVVVFYCTYVITDGQAPGVAS